MIAKNCANCKHSRHVDGQYYCAVSTRTVKLQGVERQEMIEVAAAHWCHKWRPSRAVVEGEQFSRGQ